MCSEREQGVLVPHMGLCLALLSTISAQEMSQELAIANSRAIRTPGKGFAGTLASLQGRLQLWILILPGPIPETWGLLPRWLHFLQVKCVVAAA